MNMNCRQPPLGQAQRKDLSVTKTQVRVAEYKYTTAVYTGIKNQDMASTSTTNIKQHAEERLFLHDGYEPTLCKQCTRLH